MERKDWPKWLINKNIEQYDYPSFVGYKDGYFKVILENFDDQTDRKKIELVWENLYSYTVANESYREDVWLGDSDSHWPFYKLEESANISRFKSTNIIYQDEKIYHFIIVGEEVVDILSDQDPIIHIIQDNESLIKEFSETSGYYVEEIYGQTRFGYSISDLEDFFEISEIISHNGFYKGSIIKFYDFETSEVYTPFKLEENVSYGGAIYINNSFYFLQADFNKSLISIYEYYPEYFLNKIEEFKMSELNLYNLSLMGEDLYLVSSDDKLEIYYPYRKTIELEDNESALFIKDDKIYISAWVEEGWNDEKHIAGPDYEYYDKLIVKDMQGKIILERRGNVFQHTDGTWRLA